MLVETKGFAILSLLWCLLPTSWPSDTKRTPHRCVNVLLSVTAGFVLLSAQLWNDTFFFCLSGWQVGEEMSKDLFLRPSDHQCSNQSWARWAASQTFPAGGASCRRDWLWEPWDCSVWVHVTGKCFEKNSGVLNETRNRCKSNRGYNSKPSGFLLLWMLASIIAQLILLAPVITTVYVGHYVKKKNWPGEGRGVDILGSILWGKTWMLSYIMKLNICEKYTHKVIRNTMSF